tara:strand:- start:145 stop:552 length:408 start_codon:yes stop_codon:yes gene_type:complete
MADVVTSTTILDGPRQAIMSFTYQFVDDGNESAVKKVDVSGLETSVDGDTCTGVRIAEIWYSTVGMTVEILSDASADIFITHLPSDFTDHVDMSAFGGLSSKLGTSPNGDILFTTTGAGTVGDSYNVVLRMIKDY